MGFNTKLALVAVLLPVLLAVMLARQPHLVLKIPKIGFFLYAALFGGEIPPYFNENIFKVQDKWHREGDVILSVCTKCGTTWAMATLHHIRGRGNQPDYKDLYAEVRWLDFVYYPGQSLDERIHIVTRLFEKYPFSVYKTHKDPTSFEVRNDTLYIVGVRNPVDAVASFQPFLRQHSPKFAAMWGGFPVEAGRPPSAEDDKVFEHMMLHDAGGGVPMLDILMTNLIKGWWPYRKNKNVLFVHYNDRIKDHKGEIDRMAKFAGVNLTPEELDNVAEQVSFKSMKKNSGKYDPESVFDEFKEAGKVPKDLEGVVKDLVNVGSKRDGHRELKPDFIQRIEAKLAKEFPPEVLNWVNNGGHDLPDVEFPNKKQ